MNMERIKVLVIEDDESWQEILSEHLETFDCDVDIAASITEAKKALSRQCYDMITLDMRLQEDNLPLSASGGARLLDLNVLTKNFPDVVIFVISGSIETDPTLAFNLARKYGVEDFMDKGQYFEPHRLREWVELVRARKNATNPSQKPPAICPLRIFISYAHEEKTTVLEVYERLKQAGYDPWIDAKRLLPGQDWHTEIRKAVRETQVFLVCISRHSTRAGSVNREIKFALGVAEEQPQGSIFIIPLRLEESDVPEQLSHLQWCNYFEEDGYMLLLQALQARLNQI